MTEPSIQAAPRSRQAAFSFIFATAVMNALSFGIMIPVLPNLIKEMTGGDTANATLWNGAFAVVWGVMQFFTGPILGMMSDRYGRRPVVLISLFGLGVDFVFMAFAPTLWWLLVGRILNGVTAASFSTANAYVADVTTPERRARDFGLMSSAFSFGFLIGPALGGFLAQYSLRLPFIAAAVLTLPTGSTATSSCPNPCRPNGASPGSTGAGPIPSAPSACFVHTTSCWGWPGSTFSTSWPTPSCRRSSSSTPATATTGCPGRTAWP